MKPLRTCTQCGTEAHNLADLDLFVKNKPSRYGRQNTCKDCNRAYPREYPKYPLEYHREWHKNHRAERYESVKKWREKNRHKMKAHKLIARHPERYPLADECEFCGATENLEHGHIDYAYPEIYLTVCCACNHWMDKEY